MNEEPTQERLENLNDSQFPYDEPDPIEVIEITFRPHRRKDDYGFKRIQIPLVRRIYPQLLSNKIVSTQPLLGPTGLVYYLRFRYSSNKGCDDKSV